MKIYFKLYKAILLCVLFGAAQQVMAQGPGGISTNLQRWFKADSAVTTGATMTWADISGSVANLTQATATRQPVYNTTSSLTNFNPNVVFDGTDDALSGINSYGSSTNPTTFYVVATSAGTSTNGTVYINGFTNTHRQMLRTAATASTMQAGSLASQASVLSAWVSGRPVLSRSGFNGGASVPFYLSPNGSTESLSANVSPNIPGGVGTCMGAEFNSASSSYFLFWSGSISEVIVYSGKHTAADYIKIESYLAVKYGVSKAGDYQNSAATVTWTSGGGYDNNIAGISRDDASRLNQKQSASVNTGIQPVIANVNVAATNAANTNNFSTDLSALLWGSDAGSAAFATSFAFGGLSHRMARIWKVQETGTVGTVKIAIPSSQIMGNVSQPTLLVSSDAIFDGTDTRTTMTLETLGGVSYYTATVDFTSGQFFSFGGFVTAPGGVAGAVAWYKADAGASVSQWNDQNDNAYHVTQATAANQPVLNTTSNLLNFNPNFTFDGSNDFFAKSGITTLSNTAEDVFMATNVTLTANASPFTFGTVASSSTSRNFGFDLSGFANVSYNLLLGFNNGIDARNVVQLNNFGRTGTTAGAAYIISNGGPAVTGTMSTTNSVDYISIGATRSSAAAAFFYGGQLGEVVYYGSSLTATEKQRINSYLSIKYGTTLNQTSAQNYLASDGTTVLWNATTNAAYKNNIAGIARDDASALNQKQSASVNTGIQPVIGNANIEASNAANTNNFSTDLSALIWGSDAGSAALATSFAFGGLNNRMTRIWKVQETGTVGTVKVAIPASQLTANITQPTLLVSNDATFDGTDTRTTMAQETIGGVSYYTASVDFTSGQFFSFGALVIAPGGVVSGLKFWHKADSGVTASSSLVTAWKNQVDGRQVINAGGTQRPTLANGTGTLFNFNPYIDFTSTGNTLYDAATTPFTADGDLSWFMSSRITGSGQVFGINLTPSNTGGLAYDDFHWLTSTVYDGGSGIATYSSSLNDNIQSIVTFTHNGTGNKINGYKNLSIIVNDVTNTFALGIGGYVFGNAIVTPEGGNDDGFSGQMSEQIAYNRVLSAAEIKRVQSYLALKTGVSLSQDYLASDGTTTIWTSGAGYDNNIAGIARDDASALNQKQSASVNTGIQPVIGNANIDVTNATNSNNFSADLSALLWGSDAGSTAFATSFVFGGLNNRMARIWKIQETGTVGTVRVALKSSDLAGLGSNPTLIVSADATLDGTDTRTAMTQATLGGVSYWYADVNFTSGQFFSFGIVTPAPGGVATDLKLWLRADAGTNTTVDGGSITSWNDQSALGRNAGNSNLVTFRSGTDAKAINFNPVVDFASSSSRMYNITGGLMSATSAKSNYFLVTGIPTGGVSSQKIFAGYSTSFTGGTGANFAEGPSFRATNSSHITATSTLTNLSHTPSLLGTKAMLSLALDPSGNTVTLRQNGVQSGLLTSTTSQSGNNGYVLGDDQFDGDGNNPSALATIGEVITYESNLTGTDLAKVESYLAVKYGMTMGSRSAPVSYLASDGSTIWPSSSIYQNNVFGLGKDNVSTLHQQIARSTNSGDSLIISTDNNMTNANGAHTAISADTSYLIAGNDSATMSLSTVLSGFSGLNRRTGRVWKIRETGSIGTVNLQLKGSTATHMIVSSDSTFDGSDVLVALSGGIGSYDFPTGTRFIAFAANVIAPGGLNGNLAFWYRADQSVTTSGTSVTSWKDAFNSYDATQATGSAQPTYNTTSSLFNYNPTLSFDGGDNLKTTSTLLGATTGINTYVVYLPTSASYIWNWASGGQGYSNYYGNSATDGFRAYSDNHSWIYPTDGLVTTPSISSVNWNSTSPGAFDVRNNGFLDATISSTTTFTNIVGGTSYFNVGGTSGSTGYTGRIAEVIGYNAKASVNERLKVESYLAIKYGISLSQSVSQNYLASNDSTIWDATTNAGYGNNIAGIARDDASALHQKQSASVNTDIQPVIGNVNIDASNTANTNSFSTDLSALVWGSDAGSAAFATSFAFGGLNNRMTRIWKVQERGTVGTVKVALPASQVTVSSPTLVVSSDATFDGSDSRTTMSLETLGGVSYYTATVDFSSGQFFSFGGFVTAPGGVSGSNLWLRADAGTSTTVSGSNISQWDDQSGSGNNFTQATTSSQPVYSTASANLMNYNPVALFNGLKSMSDASGIMSATTKTNAIAFVASRNDALSGNQMLVGQGINWHAPYSDATIYWDANSRVSAAWGGSVGIPSIITGYNTSTASPNRREIRRDGNILYSDATATSFAASAGTMTFGSLFNGPIGEIIYFDSYITAAQRNQIESYLAVKYGTTLGTTASPVSYLNSGGSTVWSGSSIYQTNVFGLGRDNSTVLHQQIARSANSGDSLILSTDNNMTNANGTHTSIASDLSFLMVGNDNASMTIGTGVSGLSSVNTRTARVWKVSETGSIGTVNLQLKGSVATHMIVSTDSTFGAGDNVVALTSSIGSYDFPSGTSFIAFAQFKKLPGGVADNFVCWYEANKGVSPGSNFVWTDQSGTHTAVQSLAAKQPVLDSNSNRINFNPVLRFDGSNDRLSFTSTAGLSTGSDSVVFYYVAKNKAVGSAATVFHYGATAAANTSFITGMNASNALIGGSVGTSASISNAWSPVNRINLVRSGYEGGASKAYYVVEEGKTITKTANLTPVMVNTAPSIGGRNDSTLHWNGDIAEIIGFSDNHNGKNSSVQVESYLAVKYGLTLGSKSAPISYRNSAGTITWTGSSTYQAHVIGLAKDSVTDLDQRIAQSSDTGDIITMSSDTNFVDNNLQHTAITNDLSFMLVGNDSASVSSLIATEKPSTYSSRIPREWRAQVTNFTQQVSLKFAGFGSTTGYEWYLVKKNGSSDFSSGVTQVAKLNANGEAKNITLSNDDYFTLMRINLIDCIMVNPRVSQRLKTP